MQLDHTFSDDDLTVDITRGASPNAIISRIAMFGRSILPHEEHITHLGDATIRLSKLANALCVNISWNESDREDAEFYIATNMTGVALTMHLQGVLHKYLDTCMEDLLDGS